MAISRTLQIRERASDGWQALPEHWPDCLRRILAARGIQSERDIRLPLAELPRPQQLQGMDSAVALLTEALQQQWHITVVADFDTDGATSCALAIRGLKAFGLQRVDFIVPNRFRHGYGLTPALLDEIAAEQQPDCLLTVDNGIASVSGVAAARALGMKVIVTDHHLPGEQLPAADAIINPNQPGDSFPSRNLAGVGVCFYLLLGLRQHLRQIGWFEASDREEPRLVDLLDLVALGTVADLVPLDQLNRTLVDAGLNRLRQQRSSAGIHALLNVAGRQAGTLTTTDLAFAVAPRLNAAGRMEDMGLGIELLLNDDYSSALQQARLLDDINQQRKQVEQEMQLDAGQMLDALQSELEQPPAVVCLYDPGWHQGVIGLLASRIKEQTHRPVVVLAPGDDGQLKGSARSIAGIHIRDLLAHVDAQAPGVIERFGGHAMAAGLSLPLDKLDAFQQQLQHSASQLCDPAAFEQVLLSDGQLSGPEMTLELARQLPLAAPWGQAFQAPMFHGVFELLSFQHVGQQTLHLKLLVALDDGRQVTAMAFRKTAPDWLQVGVPVVLVYRLDVNDFRQQQQLQLLVEHLLPVTQA